MPNCCNICGHHDLVDDETEGNKPVCKEGRFMGAADCDIFLPLLLVPKEFKDSFIKQTPREYVEERTACPLSLDDEIRLRAGGCPHCDN